MPIEIIQTADKFKDLKDSWNDLLQVSASHVPFLRHEYLFNWWQTLGGGEWDEGELCIFIDRDPENRIVGIAPFFRSHGQIMLLGSHEISDYLDLIAKPESLPGFVETIFQYLSSENCSTWNKLILYNLPEKSPTIPLLKAASEKQGWDFAEETIHPAPFILLPTSWEEYLKQLDDRYRNEIQRKLRKAENYFLPLDWYSVSNESQLEGDMDDFLELMANNPDKNEFLTPQMTAQMKSSARAAFQEGWLDLVFLVAGDLKIAGYMNFDYGDKILVYNSGINTLFENLSPGWVLLARVIQRAIQQGRRELDFLRGDEEYKYQFGGKDKYLIKVVIDRS